MIRVVELGLEEEKRGQRSRFNPAMLVEEIQSAIQPQGWKAISKAS